MPRPRLILTAAAALVVGLFCIAQSIRWHGASGADLAHREFLSRLEDRRWSKCHEMISTTYADRWGFGRDELSLALQDLGGPFTFGLSVEWDPAGRPQADDTGAYAATGTVRIDGNGSPAAGLIVSRFNAYAGDPFVFRWKREGVVPWRWKLVGIDHARLQLPRKYTPGDGRSATSVGF